LFHFNGPVQVVENPYKELFIHYAEKERFSIINTCSYFSFKNYWCN